MSTNNGGLKKKLSTRRTTKATFSNNKGNSINRRELLGKNPKSYEIVVHEFEQKPIKTLKIKISVPVLQTKVKRKSSLEIFHEKVAKKTIEETRKTTSG